MHKALIFLKGSLISIGIAMVAVSCTDRTPPEVTITTPSEGDIVSGIVIIKAEIVEDSPIKSFSFFVDDSLIAKDSVAPWEYEWNTSELPELNSEDTFYHVIRAVVVDQFGNMGSSEPVEVRVVLSSNAPYTPAAPWGPSTGMPGELLSFYATAPDPSDDCVSFQFDWGDGSISNWTIYVCHGDTVIVQKSFSIEDIYTVKVRAKNTDGIASLWSSGWSVCISPYGQFKWKCNLGESVITSPALGYDGTIYIGTEHYMYAVNPNGTIKWSYEVDPWRVCSSPAVGPDGTIYFGCYYYYLYALNPDGTLKWRYETEWRVESSPAIGTDGTIYFGTYDSSLVALTPQGTIKWEYKVGGIVESSPSIGANGTIYFGASDKYIYALTPSGKLDWKYFILSDGISTKIANTSPAIASDGTVYFETESGYIYAFMASHNLKWLWAIGAPIGVSPAIGTDGTLYISGGRYFYSLDPEAQRTNWWKDLGVWELNSPTVGSDGSLYIGAIDYLYSYSSDGVLKWRYHLGGKGIGATAIAEDGTIYIGAEDGYLYALTTSSKGLGNSSWPKFHHDNQNTGRFGGL